MKKLALCMIVKNEAKILARCLTHAKKYCDRFAIVDTGSTDDTEVVARTALSEFPARHVQFVHHEWKGFGDGKTEALRVARAAWGSRPTDQDRYALMLDADEIVSGDLPTTLGLDRYDISMELVPGSLIFTTRVFRLSLPWFYMGVLHEFPTMEKPWTSGTLPLMLRSPRDGARSISNPTKYADDAALLEKAIAELCESGIKPGVHGEGLLTRYQFYLAQSYRDARNDEQAAVHYARRATMGPGLNWEEIYISHLERARALRRLGRVPEAEKAFLDAHHAFPGRPEALRELQNVLRGRLLTAESAITGTLFLEVSRSQREGVTKHADTALDRTPYRLVHKGLSDNSTRAKAVPPDSLESLFYAHEGRSIDKWHHYLAVYETYLERFSSRSGLRPDTPRVGKHESGSAETSTHAPGLAFPNPSTRPVRLLEIGVQAGGSLQLWRSYLGPHAVLHGLDIDPACADRADAPTIIHIGDQSDRKVLERIVEAMGGVDIVIDDGSHLNEHQITTWETLYPLLSSHGVYICEDVHTSYWASHYGGGWKRPGTFMEHAKDLLDKLHAWYAEDDGDADETFARMTKAIHFYDSMVVFEKCDPKDEPQRSVVGTELASPSTEVEPSV